MINVVQYNVAVYWLLSVHRLPSVAGSLNVVSLSYSHHCKKLSNVCSGRKYLMRSITMYTVRLIWQMGHVTSRKVKNSYKIILCKSHAKRSAARLSRRRKNKRDKLAAVLVHLMRIEVTQYVLRFILAQSFHLSVNNVFNTVSKTFNIGHVPRWTQARSTSICMCDIPLWRTHVEVRTAAVRHSNSYVL